jgi:hypothetical protein
VPSRSQKQFRYEIWYIGVYRFYRLFLIADVSVQHETRDPRFHNNLRFSDRCQTHKRTPVLKKSYRFMNRS